MPSNSALLRLLGAFALASALLFAVACEGDGEDEPDVAEQSPTGTATPTETAPVTSTPMPPATATPSDTDTPDTPDATPTATPDEPVSDEPFDLFDLDRSSEQMEGTAVQQATRVAQHDGFDRFVIEFEGQALPGYELRYVDSATTCGRGAPVSLAGEAMLSITMRTAHIYDPMTGEMTIEARELAPDLPAILAAEEICGFEGVVTWVLGLPERLPFRVFELSDPTRLVVDVQHPGPG